MAKDRALVALGLEGASAAEEDPQAPATVEQESPSASTPEAESTSEEQVPQPTTATGARVESTPSADAALEPEGDSGGGASELAGMEEELLSNYAGAGGKLHGIKFATEDETVKCNGTADMEKLACQVKGQSFPESNRAEDGLPGMGAPTDVVGWDAAVQAPLHAEPKVGTKQSYVPLHGDERHFEIGNEDWR